MQLPATQSPHLASSQTMARISASKNTSVSTEATSHSNKVETSHDIKPQPSSSTGQQGKLALTETDYRVIAELKKIDRGVRAHEAAHLAAAGGLARGGASFTYTQGPDGQRYAVGGEVSIDTSPERDDPEATIRKAQRIQAAALAPAQPSDADRAVAASAAQMAAAARAELAAERFSTDESAPSKNLNNADSDATKNNLADENRSFTTGAADELTQIIRHVTSAENALGNLINTAA